MDRHRKKRLQQLIEGAPYKGSNAAFLEATGLTKGRLSQLLSEEEPFGERAAGNLVRKLQLQERYFEQGASNVSLASMGDRPIPVISEIHCGKFREIIDTFAAGDGESFLTTDLELGPYAFALRLEGDSMQPEFIEGERVIIDPDVHPQTGDFVAARDGKNRGTFKKYRLRGIDAQGKEVFELIPLNDKYDTLRSDLEPLEVIGTMVEHRRYRRQR
jgi:SOS-response transcriptional repressor LexA